MNLLENLLQRLEEEKKALKAKKKQKEKERRQQEIAEQRRIQVSLGLYYGNIYRAK